MKRFLVLFVLVFSLFSCKSVKRLLDKKEVTVNEITQKDVQTSETKVNDISTFRISRNQKIKLEPVDQSWPIIIVNGEDSTSVYNSAIQIEDQSTQESKTDKTVTEKNSADKTAKRTKEETVTKHKEVEKKGTHPALIWGFFLLLLVVGIMWYLKKQLPFL